MGSSKYCNKMCFVHECKSTTKRYPDKLFLVVPINPVIRKKWFAAANIKFYDDLKMTRLYCCEDHFNLKEDAFNYNLYKEVKRSGTRSCLRIKPHVVPRFFKHDPEQNQVMKLKIPIDEKEILVVFKGKSIQETTDPLQISSNDNAILSSTTVKIKEEKDPIPITPVDSKEIFIPIENIKEEKNLLNLPAINGNNSFLFKTSTCDIKVKEEPLD